MAKATNTTTDRVSIDDPATPAEQSDSGTEPLAPLAPGGKVHLLGTLTWAFDYTHHEVIGYGTEVTISSLMLEAFRDRFGRSILDPDVLDCEEEQVRRWGKVMVRRGPWPHGVDRLVRGSQEWWDQAEAERRAAWKIDDEQERLAALRAVRAKYGTQSTSRTLATFDQSKREPGAWV